MNKTPRSQHHQAGFLHVPACSWYFFCKITFLVGELVFQQYSRDNKSWYIYIYYYIYIGICGTYMENIILHINIINGIWRIYELSWIRKDQSCQASGTRRACLRHPRTEVMQVSSRKLWDTANTFVEPKSLWKIKVLLEHHGKRWEHMDKNQELWEHSHTKWEFQ